MRIDLSAFFAATGIENTSQPDPPMVVCAGRDIDGFGNAACAYVKAVQRSVFEENY